MDEAREQFARAGRQHQRRASRIAYQYLRDAAEADEAVQDAFVKVFSHIGSYREAWPFEVWFTRILINGCLDRRKARRGASVGCAGRRSRAADEAARLRRPTRADPKPPARARAARPHGVGHRSARRPAAHRLHAVPLGDCTPREVSAMTGLNESTVRVHLFRAARKLRGLLGGKRDGPRAHHSRTSGCSTVSGRCGRRAARSAGGRASGRLRRVRRALRGDRAIHGNVSAEGDGRSRRRLHARTAARSAARRSRAGSNTSAMRRG